MHRKACIILIALASSLGGASDAALDRATLRGVAAVNLVIDPVSPDIEKEGATASALVKRLEEQLRAGGIQIDTASNEFVALRVTAVRVPRGPFAIAMTLGLYQPVTLVRDKNLKTSTQTWEVDTVVLADNKQVLRACMDSVDELTGRFVTAHRSVNAAASGEQVGKAK